MHPSIALFLFQASKKLVSLSSIDIIIIALYFLMVLGIGYYLKNYTKTGEDFFMAGRDMTFLDRRTQLRRRQFGRA